MGYVGILPENALRYVSKEQRAPMGRAGLTIPEIDEANAIKDEKALHEQIIQDLNRRMVTYGHARMDRKSTFTIGWPDFTFSIRGQAIAVECKAHGKDLDGKQPEVRDGLLRDGWTYIVCYHLEQVVELFRTGCATCGNEDAPHEIREMSSRCGKYICAICFAKEQLENRNVNSQVS